MESTPPTPSPDRPAPPPHPEGASHCVLRRTVRLDLGLAGRLGEDRRRSRSNPYAAWPSSDDFALHLECTLSVRGVPETQSGYVADIADLDRCVRETVLALLAPALPVPARLASPPPSFPSPPTLLRALLDAAPRHLRRPASEAAVALNPALSLSMSDANRNHVLLRQTFEFAASHRLHCPELSDEQNRQLFGKCNNPNGHGHNYRLMVDVECAVDDHAVARPRLHEIEEIVRREAIDRLDHRHLNLDVPEFASLNPSVENIARVIHGMLATPLAKVGGTLRQISVWETEKTCCCYPPA